MVYVINYSWILIPAKNAGSQLYFCGSWPYSHVIEKQKYMYYFFFSYNSEKKVRAQ